MVTKDIIEILAPCGLNCKKCLAFYKGDIQFHSSRLKESLGSFDRYAERFSTFMPVFKNYPQFKELLEFFTQGECRGCRSGKCVKTGCLVPECTRTKGIDFCFQCNEFPCEKSGLDADLHKRWLSMNQRMQEIGIEQYFKESMELPRYK